MTEACEESVGKRILQYLMRYGMYLIFLLLMIYFSVSNPNFLTFNNLILILQQASPHGIAVIGIIFVLTVGGIDISIGRNMFLASTLVGVMTVNVSKNFLDSTAALAVCLGIAVAVGIVFGLLNGIIITKFRMVPFITTLAVGSVMRGLGLTISNTRQFNITFMSPLASGRIFNIPYVLIIFAVLLVVSNYILRSTTFGRHLMAIGNDPENAKKIGINVDRDTILVYVICAVLAALGGILSAGQIGTIAATFGEGNEFIAISAAVVGGASLFGGKATILPGAVVGILLITLITNGMAMVNASPYAYTIVRGAIIFLAVMLDSINYKGVLR